MQGSLKASIAINCVSHPVKLMEEALYHVAQLAANDEVSYVDSSQRGTSLGFGHI